MPFRRSLLFVVLVALLGISVPPTSGQSPVASTGSQFVAGEMVLKLRAGALLNPDQYRGMAILGRIPGTGWVRVAVPAGKERAQAIAASADRDVVEEALPNYLAAATWTPNDTLFSQQWGLATIRAPLVWDATKGSISVTIAVLDTGIDLSHPDLADKVWTNPGEIPGNGVDDDQDGLVDDVHGWNWISNSPNVQDDHGHGSHVSGIAAAATNNGIGVAGASPASPIMPLKVLDNRGLGSYFDIAQAIRYAADHGARIVSMSLAGEENGGTLLQDAIDYAYAKGVLILAAAGNFASSGGSIPNPILYPAALPRVVSVAATDQSDQSASYSEYNSAVDIAAPGSSIMSTTRGGGYTRMTGTSMATPFVSGVAALVWAVRPQWTNEHVEAQLKATAAKVGAYPYEGGRNDHMGAGRLDAAAAVWTLDMPALTVSPEVGVAIAASTPVTRTVRITSSSSIPVTVTAAITPGADWLQIAPAQPQTVSAGQPISFSLVISPFGQPFGMLEATVAFQTGNPYAAVAPPSIPMRVSHTEQLYQLFFRASINYRR